MVITERIVCRIVFEGREHIMLDQEGYCVILANYAGTKRIAKRNIVYHVLNRANGRLRMFRKDEDFAAFRQILAQGVERFGIRLTVYCLMSNHWHLLRPRREDERTLCPRRIPKKVNEAEECT